MLHWPDSMFTYVREAKVLLPNDGFGQHLATSKRFADEVDMSVALEEASRYYANILMPFGGQVQRMLGKIGEMGLDIEAIGPSHGVVWRRPADVAAVVGAYGRWSSGEAPERVSLIYDTMWHSTEKMTMAIADGVAQEDVACSVLRVSRCALADIARMVLESRAFLVGSPTLNSGVFPAVGGFLTHMKGLRPKNRIAGAYGSHGWGGGAVKQIDTELRVTAALSELPADYQEVIMLRNLQRLSFNEVAGRMDRSRPAVQMLWMRAIRKLQEAMEEKDEG